MVTADAVGRFVEFDAADGHAAGERQARTRHQHAVADQRGGLHGLVLVAALEDHLQRGVQLVDAFDRADLRHLRGHLGVVHRIQRILVLQLRHEQLEEAVLRADVLGVGFFARDIEAGENRLRRIAGADGGGGGSHDRVLRLLAERQGLLHQRLGGVHDLDVALVGTRGGNHVHHLLDHVHIGHGDEALFVGGRVLRVVDDARRRQVLDHPVTFTPTPPPATGCAANTTCLAR
jgi:hypothetical protein